MKLTHVIAATLATLGLVAIGLAGRPAPSIAPTPSTVAIGCPVSYDCDAANGDVLGTFGTLGACRAFCVPRGGTCQRVFC
jgi:hypothetical protein